MRVEKKAALQKFLARVRLSLSLFLVSSGSAYSAIVRFPRSSSKMVVLLNQSRIASGCVVVVAIILFCVHDSHQQLGACVVTGDL